MNFTLLYSFSAKKNETRENENYIKCHVFQAADILALCLRDVYNYDVTVCLHNW